MTVARRPHFAQVMIWVLVYIGIRRSYQKLPTADALPSEPASIFTILPAEWLASPTLFEIAHWVLAVAGPLWALNILISITPWMTALSFTAVVGVYYENATHIAHTYNLAVLVLWVHAAWYYFRRHEIAAAVARGNFFRDALYPGWVFHTSVVCIALFHVFAGASKLWFSGPEWANGVSLQLWVHLWGNESTLSAFLLSNRSAALWLQVGTLVIETGAILAIVSRRLRYAVGLGLGGLYAGILLTFDFQFKYNALIVAAFFLPTYEVMEWVAARGRDRMRLPLDPERSAARIVGAILARLDLFGWVIPPQRSESESVANAP